MSPKRRYELSDAQWARLEPLLPPEKPGRPNDDHRQILNGILWVLNSGAPWRDLPLLRDNQNHVRCVNQASLTLVSFIHRKLHPAIMMSGRQTAVKPSPSGSRRWRLRA